MTFFGFQYCEITASEDIEVLSLIGEVVGSATEEGASFVTSSRSINQLYSNVMWGQRGNYLSIPTDCPQRDERLGWTGDTQVFCRAASYNANVSAFFEKWMRDMRDGQRSDGAYPDVAPHSWVGYGQAAWADAGVIVPWTIYLMYDNKKILQDIMHLWRNTWSSCPVKKETVITITVPEQIMATGYRTKIPNAAMSVYATTHIRHN